MQILTYKNTAIHLHPKKQAKHLRLKFVPKENVFHLTVPPRIRQREIDEFLIKAQPWLDKQQKHIENTPILAIEHGATIPILGKSCLIHFEKGGRKKVVHEGDRLTVFHPTDQHKLFLLLWLQEQIRHILSDISKDFAKKLGVKIKQITVKDTTSRWGSCSSTGNLAYSWRMAFAPKEVTEYLCAHEVSHLVHMNHSLAFWTTVASLCPEHKKHRKWLKEQGRGLFLYM